MDGRTNGRTLTVRLTNSLTGSTVLVNVYKLNMRINSKKNTLSNLVKCKCINSLKIKITILDHDVIQNSKIILIIKLSVISKLLLDPNP